MPKHIKDLMPSILPTQKWKAQLLTNWNTIIGDLHTQVCLEKIEEHSLVLGVTNNSWLQELYMLSPLLIEKINAQLDKPRIKQIRFKIANKKTINKKKIHTPTKKQPMDWSVSTKEQKTLDAIEDTQLRDALKNFLIRCYQEK